MHVCLPNFALIYSFVPFYTVAKKTKRKAYTQTGGCGVRECRSFWQRKPRARTHLRNKIAQSDCVLSVRRNEETRWENQ